MESISTYNRHINLPNLVWFHPFVFTGKEKDSETGYYYFDARYHDPSLSGLFLSVDPMADKYPSISPYAYCAWNPMKLVDPDGAHIKANLFGKKNSINLNFDKGNSLIKTVQSSLYVFPNN